MAAVGAFFVHRFVPEGLIALGILVAAVENLAAARLLGHHFTFPAFRAGDAGLLLEGLGGAAVLVLAFEIFAEATMLHDHLAAALFAFLVAGLVGGQGFLVLAERLGLLAFWIAGATQELRTPAAGLERHGLAAIGAVFAF